MDRMHAEGPLYFLPRQISYKKIPVVKGEGGRYSGKAIVQIFRQRSADTQVASLFFFFHPRAAHILHISAVRIYFGHCLCIPCVASVRSV